MTNQGGSLPPIGSFGRFELLGRLAVGGMAEVYLARERIAGGASRRVVIKRILPHVASDERFVEMFFNEARVAVDLRHPNLCHIYEVGEHAGSCYIAMEWVDGVSLGRLIRRTQPEGGVPIEIAAKIIAQVADALHYAHRATNDDGEPLGIIHRDVSPQNIMISYDGAVKLLDFGVAKATIQHTTTEDGHVKGKLAYMSPQQAQGEPIDARADIFALGVDLYEALVARHLYRKSTHYDTLQAVIQDPVPSVRDVRPEVPPVIDAIVQCALAKEPERRFQTAGELRDALEHWLANEQWMVHSGRIADLLERLFENERAQGPELERNVDSFPPAGAGPGKGGAVDRQGAGEGRRRRVAMVLGAASIAGMLAGAAAVAGWWAGGAERARQQAPGAVSEPPQRVAAPQPEQSAPAPPGPMPARDGAVARGSSPPAAADAADDAVGEASAPMPTLRAGAMDAETASGREQRAAGSAAAPAKATRGEEPNDDQAPTGDEPGSTPARKTPAKNRSADARLSINTRPWSRVYVNERLLGTTPIGKAEIRAGTVRLRIVDREGQEHRHTIEVEPDEHAKVSYDFRQK